MDNKPMGGTELLLARLQSSVDLEGVQIIPSRLEELQDDKIRIYWCHDNADDPMYNHLRNEGWRKFHKIVFVSYLQQQEFINRFGILPSCCTVMHNAIVPIAVNIDEKNYDRIELVYLSTPHRGLGLLVHVFQKLTEKYGDGIHLHVYSSLKLYGRDEQDKQFEPLYDIIRNDPNMTYYGSVSNDEIRESLKTKHIFAYPSIYRETGCLCLMEAMSAGLLCVHPSLGALPETGAHWTLMYDFHENHQVHAARHHAALDQSIQMLKQQPPIIELKSQKSFSDLYYAWDLRALQWEGLLNELRQIYKDVDKSVPKVTPIFRYGA